MSICTFIFRMIENLEYFPRRLLSMSNFSMQVLNGVQIIQYVTLLFGDRTTCYFFAFNYSHFIVYCDEWRRKYLQKCVTITHSFFLFFLINVPRYVYDFILSDDIFLQGEVLKNKEYYSQYIKASYSSQPSFHNSK